MSRLAVLTLLIATSASAQIVGGPNLRDVMTARNFGMAGAYSTLGYGTEAIGGNPAALSLYKHYQIELNGAYDVTYGYGHAGIGLLDSQTNDLAVGLSYQFVTYGGDERRWAHVTTGAIALPITDAIHIGAAVKHQVITGATTTNSVTMNAGLAFRPVEFLTFGVSGQNLIGVYNNDLPRYFVASVSGQFAGQLSPAFDLHVDLNQPTARFRFLGGIEWLIAETVPIRAGYTYDGIDGHQYLGLGIGYFLAGSGVDIAYRHEFTAGSGRMLSLTLKLKI